MEKSGIASFFYTHGFLCASHPVEVLVLCVTGTVCLLTLSIYDATHALDGTLVPTNGKVPLPTGIHVHVGATSYFLALLCIYLQCKKLLNTGSKNLVGIVCFFSAFSCIVYTSIVGNIFGGELEVLREALPFFFLLNDFITVGAMAKFALLSKSYEEAPSKIAQAVATLCPSVTLNTLVGALVIGVGTLSGVEELETASYFGCLALLTHYLIFMTFLPACLSLFLELCDRGKNKPTWQMNICEDLSTEEHEQTPNPLLQHVKLIMSAGLVFVHIHSRFLVRPEGNGASSIQNQSARAREDWLSRFLAVNSEQVVAIVLALLVAAKYLYLEKDDSRPLLEPQEIYEKAKPALPQPTVICSTDKNTLIKKAVIKRTRRSTFSIGDNATLSYKELNEEMESIHEFEQPQELCTQGNELFNKSTTCIPVLKAVDNERDMTRKQPLKRTFSFPHLKSKSNSSCSLASIQAPKKNVVVPSSCKLELPEFFPEESDSICRNSKLKERAPVIRLSGPSCNSAPANTASSNLNVMSMFERKACRVARNVEECKRIMKEPDGIFSLTDEEICLLVESKVIPGYQLESALRNLKRAVHIRRKVTARRINRSTEMLSELPYDHYDYTRVSGACCENVVGYMPVPVGVAGPLLLDGQQFQVPMATTEGCLVASTNRGCSALMRSGGVRSSIISDGMTRGPVMRFPSALQACDIKLWLEEEQNFKQVKTVFDSTSRFARLKSIKCAVAGRLLFARFVATTGDAMGMNMLSKGTEKALHHIQEEFPCMEIISLSGNFCTDKKATALNWIEGRGKSVVCEAIVPRHIVSKVLKTSVTALTELNNSKNLVGSAMAGAIGGFNAQAANIVTALFIATGQDPAQSVSSSNCITLLEPCGPTHEDLYISCTMPSLEVGTVGGGTVLGPQGACLEMLGVRGASETKPGQNAAQLARIVCGTVLAGELSLLSALAAGQLVKSHLKHNRSTINLLSSEEAAKNCAVL